MPYVSVNPATGEVLRTFTEHTNEQMQAALDAADKAFRIWSAVPIADRAKVMHLAAQLLLRKKEELASL